VTPHRIGLVVPSSNVTVETEVPALLARHTAERFSFYLPGAGRLLAAGSGRPSRS